MKLWRKTFDFAETATTPSQISIDKERIIATQVIKKAFAYPLLTTGYHEERGRLFEKIKQTASNLVPIGRTGSFQYVNSDEALSLCLK